MAQTDVFTYLGNKSSIFALARGHTYRDLVRKGTHVELRPQDKFEAERGLFDAAKTDSGRLRNFFRANGVTVPALSAQRSPSSQAEELVSLSSRSHFGILRRITAADRGADRRGPAEGPVKTVLDVIKKERDGEISYNGLLYRIVAAQGFRPPRPSNGIRFEVVPPAEAEKLLQAMADQARGERKVQAALEEAARFVDKPGTTASLVLLREVRGGGGAAPKPAPPPPPPAPRSSSGSTSPDTEPSIRLVNIEAATFVPGAETTKIMYAIDGPVAKAASVTMIVRSVPAKRDPSIVERLAIPGPYPASGTVDWDGQASTPGGFITLRDSPYEITFELVSKSGKLSTSKTGKIKLEIKETKIVVDDNGPLDVPDKWRKTVNAFIAELKKSGMPGDCEGRVIIESPLFKINSGTPGDMYTDASFVTYRSTVGMGPPLPFLAQIKLKAKDGTGKRSAPVLIGTRLLWDFRLETSGELEAALGARGAQPTAKAFMKKIGAHEEAATQPKGASAHFKVGGLRAKSADRAAAGIQWLSGDDWDMTQPPQRDWAAFTSCGNSADDAVADSGVYFSGGRMAGDTFKVRAVVDVDEAFDVKDDAPPDGAPATNRSNVVKFVNWRSVPIVGNWIVGAGTTPVSIPPLTAEYKRAAMLIEPASGVIPKDVKATWAKAYRDQVDEYVKNGTAFLDKALNRDHGDWAIHFIDFMDYWKLVNPDAGFFGTLWERVKTFFGGDDKEEYQKKCDDMWWQVMLGATARIPLPEGGITALKFGSRGPHNQNPNSSYTAGMAPAIPGVTSRTKSVFWQFTEGADTETFIHEVGHSLFLAHAPGHFEPPKQPPGFTAAAHDKGQICLMSYHSDKQYLCGLCLLKLGGRDYLKIKNDGTIP